MAPRGKLRSCNPNKKNKNYAEKNAIREGPPQTIDILRLLTFPRADLQRMHSYTCIFTGLASVGSQVNLPKIVDKQQSPTTNFFFTKHGAHIKVVQPFRLLGRVLAIKGFQFCGMDAAFHLLRAICAAHSAFRNTTK